MIEKIVSKEVYKKRLKTCFDCQFYNEKKNKCNVCGCFLIIKASMPLFKCPLRKWKDDES